MIGAKCVNPLPERFSENWRFPYFPYFGKKENKIDIQLSFNCGKWIKTSKKILTELTVE